MDEERQSNEVAEAPAAPAAKKRSKSFNYLGIASLLAVTALVGGLQYAGVIDFRTMSAPGLAVSATDPEKVLATVNGAEIRQKEVEERLTQITNVLKAQGADLSETGLIEEYKTRILDELIDNSLLTQAATDAGITVSDETVEAEYQGLIEMFGGAEALAGQLELVGMTEDDLRQNLREQKLIEAFVATRTGTGSIDVTEEEVKAYYDQSIAGAPPEATPPYEDVKELLRQEIAQKKAAEQVQAIVEELKASAEITRASA